MVQLEKTAFAHICISINISDAVTGLKYQSSQNILSTSQNKISSRRVYHRIVVTYLCSSHILTNVTKPTDKLHSCFSETRSNCHELFTTLSQQTHNQTQMSIDFVPMGIVKFQRILNFHCYLFLHEISLRYLHLTLFKIKNTTKLIYQNL